METQFPAAFSVDGTKSGVDEGDSHVKQVPSTEHSTQPSVQSSPWSRTETELEPLA